MAIKQKTKYIAPDKTKVSPSNFKIQSLPFFFLLLQHSILLNLWFELTLLANFAEGIIRI